MAFESEGEQDQLERLGEQDIQFERLGEQGLLVRVGRRIDRALQLMVLELDARLREKPFAGMTETVPAYASLAVYFDAWVVYRAVGGQGDRLPFELVCEHVRDLLASPDGADVSVENRIVDIPVCYGGAYGPDLDAVAHYTGLTPEEVVRRHTAGEYAVYMIGFLPGFPYLGGLDERLATPRRGTPRLVVPAGSVGIAGAQTGVYPLESPGGWQLIGRTPIRLFRPEADSVSLLQAGDRVRFTAIGAAEFEALAEGSPSS